MTDEPHAPLPLLVAGFYKFTALEDLPGYRAALLELCQSAQVFGTILLAPEGINGTIAGPREGIDAVLGALRALPGCADLKPRLQEAEVNPFFRMKVRLKREIITMGMGDLDPASQAGTYVAPEDWNAVLQDPDTVVIDTRNTYEVRVGTFKGAIDPQLESFGDFPAWLETFLKTNTASRVAMFCTGGIRCEKSTALARRMGVEEVVHLKGGILDYLTQVPETDSHWTGECFVFDQRVAVGHGLAPGTHKMCYACQEPIHDSETSDPRYVPGVSCPRCYDSKPQADRERFAERGRQIRLASERGTTHLGTVQSARPS